MMGEIAASEIGASLFTCFGMDPPPPGARIVHLNLNISVTHLTVSHTVRSVKERSVSISPSPNSVNISVNIAVSLTVSHTVLSLR